MMMITQTLVAAYLASANSSKLEYSYNFAIDHVTCLTYLVPTYVSNNSSLKTCHSRLLLITLRWVFLVG